MSKTENISLSLPSWLLEQLNEHVEFRDASRSQWVSGAIRERLLRENDSPDLWFKIIKHGKQSKAID